MERARTLAHRPEIVGCGCLPLKPEKGGNILRAVGLKPYIIILLILSSGWSEFSWIHCVQVKLISRLHRDLPPRRTASQHGMSNEWIGSSRTLGVVLCTLVVMLRQNLNIRRHNVGWWFTKFICIKDFVKHSTTFIFFVLKFDSFGWLVQHC